MSIILLFFLTNVYANIKCKDGSKSRSCTYCHRGCCSGHFGCMKDTNGNDVEYIEKTKDNSIGWLGYIGVGTIAVTGGYVLKKNKKHI